MILVVAAALLPVAFVVIVACHYGLDRLWESVQRRREAPEREARAVWRQQVLALHDSERAWLDAMGWQP